MPNNMNRSSQRYNWTYAAVFCAVWFICFSTLQQVQGAQFHTLFDPPRPSITARNFQRKIVFHEQRIQPNLVEVRAKNLETNELSSRSHNTVHEAAKEIIKEAAKEFLTEYLADIFGVDDSPANLIQLAKDESFTAPELIERIRRFPVRRSMRILTNNMALCNVKLETFGTGISFSEISQVVVEYGQFMYAYLSANPTSQFGQCSVATAVRSVQQFIPNGPGFCTSGLIYGYDATPNNPVSITSCAKECAEHPTCMHFSVRISSVNRCELYISCPGRTATSSSFYTYSYVAPYEILLRGEVGFSSSSLVCPAYVGSYINSGAAEVYGAICPVSVDLCNMECRSDIQSAVMCGGSRNDLVRAHFTSYANRGCGDIPVNELCAFVSADAEQRFQETVAELLDTACAFDVPLSTLPDEELQSEDLVTLGEAYDTSLLEEEITFRYNGSDSLRASFGLGFGFVVCVVVFSLVEFL